MFKKSIFLGVTSGLLAGVAGVVLQTIYTKSFYIDFSGLTVNLGKSIALKSSPTNIVLVALFTGVLAGIIHTLLSKYLKSGRETIFNLLFAFASFGAMLLPIGATLPLDAEEEMMLMFPGFGMTLVFFPLLMWLTLKPLFFGKKG